MAFKKVGGAKTYFKYAECNPGQVLVKAGRYMGPEQGTYGIQHVFLEETGTENKTVVLNSAGHLNYLLKTYARVGKDVCNVIYAEKKALTKGPFKNNDCHVFELEIDDGDGATVRSHTDVVPDHVLADKPAPATFDGPDISL